MNINKLDYIAPTAANPIGSITFEVSVPVLYKEGQTQPVNDSEEAEVNLSPETQKLLQDSADSIINDINKK